LFNDKIKENSIATYIPATDSAENILKKIKIKAPLLLDAGIKIKITTDMVDEQDWAESWKEFFHVTKITDRIIVKPEWRDYKKKENELVIELDPGMAFGTGTHPTTSLCMKMIDQYLNHGQSFLDVGTGSGILMITAAKLGAEYGLGIDNDELAVKIAKENLDKNKIDPDKFIIGLNTMEDIKKTHNKTGFDMICANILAHVIIDIMPLIKSNLNRSGIAIVSGIIREKEKLVLQSIKENKLELVEILHMEEWVAIAIKKSA
jgi:ribosomal protein L11 methyltransferase